MHCTFLIHDDDILKMNVDVVSAAQLMLALFHRFSLETLRQLRIAIINYFNTLTARQLC